MTSSTFSESSEHRKNNSIKRLLQKLSFHIGYSCRNYISWLLDQHNLSDMEIEILERIFTSGLYSDDVLEAACITASDAHIQSVVDFNFLISDVNNTFDQYDISGKTE
jgi:hypothetical protein